MEGSSSSISPTTGLKKGAWTPEEDQKLIDYVNQYGVPNRNWTQVPAKAGLSRCRKSCRFRWKNYLDPDIKRGNYTKEEDDLIIYLHTQLEFGWAAIADWLPGRTDCDIKNHWHTKLNKNAKPVKEKRKPGGPGGNKRGGVHPNNTTPVIFESSENQYMCKNSTPIILESSPLSLVSSTKSHQNLEGSTSSHSLSLPTPNLDNKNISLLKEVIIDLDIPSKNHDGFSVLQECNDMSSSVLQECWDLPIEDVEMLVCPSILPHTIEEQPFCEVTLDAVEDIDEFNSYICPTPQYWMSEKLSSPEEFSSLTRRTILRRKTSKFTSPVISEGYENQDVDKNSQVTLQNFVELPVSPTLSSWFPCGKYSSAVSVTEVFHHISPEEFSELTSEEEFSEEQISKITCPKEISEFTSPEKFTCFTCLNSLVSLFQNSLNSLVSLCNFKKCN